MPALPLDEAGKYVAAAYTVFAALLLVYIAIMGMRLARMQREIAEIADRVERRSRGESQSPPRGETGRTVGERIAP